jgi:hypothetical protein
MEPASNYDKVPLCKILYFERGVELLAEKKEMGIHNKSENGRGAWVALYAHPTHTDTDINKHTCNDEIAQPKAHP